MARSMNSCMTPRAVACAWTLTLLFGATGCTICPDPFDYSGPVPNGSAPQNDFRARSNGIAPLGGVPRPWPPIVQAVPDRDDASQTAVTAAVEAATEPAEAVPDAERTEPPAPAADEAVRAVAGEASADEAESPADELPIATEPALEEILPPTAPPRPQILPPLRETPGWRPRG